MAANDAQLKSLQQQWSTATGKNKKKLEEKIKFFGGTPGSLAGGGSAGGGGTTGGVPTLGVPPVTPTSDTKFPGAFVTGEQVPQRPTDLKQATNETIYNAGEEAKRLPLAEEKRWYAAEDLTKGAVEEANVPTLDDQDISLAFGQDVDAAAPDFLGKMSSARDYFG